MCRSTSFLTHSHAEVEKANVSARQKAQYSKHQTSWFYEQGRAEAAGWMGKPVQALSVLVSLSKVTASMLCPMPPRQYSMGG